jgi:peptidoglycan hydrolase-like protein with peptidoglycan-binding domain
MAGPRRTLRGAVGGEHVRALQRALVGAGFEPGENDGVYGPRTAAAVRRFQESHRIPADGVVGKQTWDALLPGEPFVELLHGASGGDDVRELQERLAALGHDPGAADGVYGPATAAAVARLQSANGLAATGVAGSETWDALDGAEPAPERRVVYPEIYVLHHENRLDEAAALAQVIADRGGPLWMTLHTDRKDALDPDELANARLIVWGLDAGFTSSDESLLRPLLDRAARGELRIVTVALIDNAYSPPLLRDLESVPAEDFGAFLDRVFPRSMLPGYSADTTGGHDLLGIQDRVDFLASVLAARQLETPLAIGLFGDWGSGKSFFMRRLQERIAALAEESVQAAGRGEPSYYCTHVRQVTFNAWLYAGGEIWPSFAAQVFRSVTGAEADVPQGPTQEHDLVDYQERLEADVRSLADRRGRAELEEAALDERIEAVTGEIAERRAALVERGQALGEAGGAAARAISDAGESASALRRIARGWRDLRPTDVLLVAAPLVAAAVVAAGIGGTTATLVLLGAGTALSLAAKALRYVDEATSLRREVRELEASRAALRAERDERARSKGRAEAGLEEAIALPLLPQFAEEQAQRWAQRERLGVVTEIRLAFERLSRQIDESRAARSESGAVRLADQVPIDRVVVYVDDLDRCQHEVVVGVLETIKLLVDLPHFVVVVGVDSRWLFRSLELHFAEVMSADGRDPDAWAATPQNYLEKIFQYSVVLPPIEADGFGRLIDALLPTEQAAAAHVPVPDVEAPADDGAPSEPVEPAAVATPIPTAAPTVDLTPGDLVVTPAEREFVKRLAPMFETPRAAKRLANVYRLLRVSVGSRRLAEPEAYEAVLLLLALGIGFPGLAGDAFRAIARAPSGEVWGSFLSGLATRNGRGGDPELRENAFVDDLGPRDAAAWDKLSVALGDSTPDALRDRPLDTFAEWIPEVAEFSFHPWQALLPSTTPG